MERAFYLIEKYQDQWVVSASGNKIMTCKKKKTALQAVRSATLLLHDLQAACPHQETVCRQDAVDQAPVSLGCFIRFRPAGGSAALPSRLSRGSPTNETESSRKPARVSGTGRPTKR
jgi:hypothetical protein